MRARIFTLVSPIVSLVLVLGTLGVLAQGSQTGARREQAMAQQQTQNVTLVGQIGGGMRAVAHQGNYAYVGVGPRLVVLDVSDPPLPAIVGQTGVLPALVWGVAVVGNYAYVADGEAGLHIIDVSDPATPGEAGFYDTPGWAGDVAVAGDYAYVADGSGLRIIDVSSPVAPREAGFYDTPGYAVGVAVAGNYAYIADSESGLRIIDVSDPARRARPASTTRRATPMTWRWWGTMPTLPMVAAVCASSTSPIRRLRARPASTIRQAGPMA